MPLVRISLLKGKPRAHIRAISEGVHQALIDAYKIPTDDRFQMIDQYDPEDLVFDPDYLGIHRSADVVFIHITAGNWRDTAQKKQLFAAIADNLLVPAWIGGRLRRPDPR